MKKLTLRHWAGFLLIGLVGQLAWTVENMYLNVFLYNTSSTDPSYIAAMVAASALTATVTTWLMGTLSDRLGRRKGMICGGYILWGAATAAFGLISPEAMGRWFPGAQAVSAAALTVVLMDCLMTFFGSTANDGAFNAYITDVTAEENRGRVESVLAVLPLISMLIIFGFFDGMTQKGQWKLFFLIFGAAATITGVISIFLLRETPRRKERRSFLQELIFGFRPCVIRENADLYLTLCAGGIFSVAVQIFFPYLIIYMQNYLKLDQYAIVLGIVLIISSAVSVAGGRWIDQIGKRKMILPCAGIMLLGLLGMFFARGMVWVIGAGIVMMSGYMLVTAAISALIRDYTPGDQAGLFQGIRMIFMVLIPMVIGPFIGAFVIRNSGSTYLDLGVEKNVPTPGIFLAAGAVLLLVLIPVQIMSRRKRQ